MHSRTMASLEPSGPFVASSVKRWFHSGDRPLRNLDLDAYSKGLVDDGMPTAAAIDMKARLSEHGATRVAWAAAAGGHGRHFRKFWDVRMVETVTPASEAVPEIMGAGPGRPLGGESVPSLTKKDGVLKAFLLDTQPGHIRFKGRATLKRIKTHYTKVGYAALAVEQVGATVVVVSDDASEVRPALVSMVQRLLQEDI